MGNNLHIVAPLTARFQYGGMCDFSGCDSKVQIKEEIAVIILFDILKRIEKGKIDEGRPGSGQEEEKRKDTTIISYRN